MSSIQAKRRFGPANPISFLKMDCYCYIFTHYNYAASMDRVKALS